jgi:hypothetical protein
MDGQILLKMVLQPLLIMVGVSFVMFWIRRESRENKPHPTPKGQTLVAPRLMYWVGWIGLIGFGALIVCAGLFPGNSENVWIAQAVFGCLAGIAALLLYCCFQWTISWDDQTMSGPNWYGKRLQCRWEEVTDLTYRPVMQAFILEGPNGIRIWIPDSWIGIAQFLDAVHQRLPQGSFFQDELYQQFKDYFAGEDAVDEEQRPAA